MRRLQPSLVAAVLLPALVLLTAREPRPRALARRPDLRPGRLPRRRHAAGHPRRSAGERPRRRDVHHQRRGRPAVPHPAPGQDRDLHGRRRAAPGLPRHPGPRQRQRRGGPALGGVPPPLRRERLPLRQLHERRPRHRDRPLPRLRRREPRRPGERPHPADDPAAVRQPQGGPAPVRPRRLPLHRHGRRRLRLRPRLPRPARRHPAGQDAAHRRRPERRDAALLRHPAGQPVPRRAAIRWTRSGPSACATPGASPSTARRATSGSPTSARTGARRSTSSPPAAAAARTTAGR